MGRDSTPVTGNFSNFTRLRTYYECTPCGYTAPAGVAIGLCPHCGDRLQARTH